MDYSPTKTRAVKYAGTYLAIIAVIVSFGAGVYAGQSWYIKKQVTSADGGIDISKVININRSINKSDSVEFNQFWEVWERVKTKYVKQPVNEVDLFYGAIQGMVYGLNDPYSMYLPPKPASDFAKSLSGEFSGIGAEIGVKENQLVIVAPLADSPAEKAGIRPGDAILGIDNLSTLGMDVELAVQKIRGSATSSVKLTILRTGWDKPQDFTIHRATINIPSVTFEMKGTVGYMRIRQFNDRTQPLFSKFIDEMKAKKATGLVLDLRNNPGGYLDSAVSMASEWIKEGRVVSERFSNGEENVHQTIGTHRLAGVKTVVLINGGSASASEIVAGALKDAKAATLIGEKTFGKGSVQDFETLPDGSALKITVAEWVTPNGNHINEKGIDPDIEIKSDYSKAKVGEDPALAKALEQFK